MINTECVENKKYFIKRGTVQGIIAGILTSVFDSFYMLSPEVYVPPTYPLFLVSFNVIFWGACGLLSGLAAGRFGGYRIRTNAEEAFCWIVFFLVPFSIVYGALGRLSLRSVMNSTFDNHLTFVWVLLILLLLILNIRKNASSQSRTDFFVPELVVIILIFNLCSNIHVLPVVQKSFNVLFSINILENQDVFMSWYTRFCIVTYILATGLILALYFLQQRKIKGLDFKRGQIIALLFLCACGSLASTYFFQYRMNAKKILPSQYTEKNTNIPAVSNIILIVLDTVRADFFSDSRIKPFAENLLALAEESVVFDNCIANSSWTPPSHASLFTGLLPVQHGVHNNLEFGPLPVVGFPEIFRPLDHNFVTLAEIFRDNGYRTAGISANKLITPKFNFDQGFETYFYGNGIGSIDFEYPFRPIFHLFCSVSYLETMFLVPYIKAGAINAIASGVLEKLAPENFFLFINYMDAHAPYYPPRPFHGCFSDAKFPHIYNLEKAARHLLRRIDSRSWNSFQLDQYRGEIAYLDHELGKFFAKLKALGVFDSSLIIITSDHGEAFGEHGYTRHRIPLYPEVINVPLVIKYPFSRQTGTVQDRVLLSDLFRIILSICDMPMPDYLAEHASIPAVAEFYQAELGKHRALFDGKFKLMKFEKQGSFELYDLEADPLNKNNLAQDLPDVVNVLNSKLLQWENEHQPQYEPSQGDHEALDMMEVKKTMKALGYIQ